MVDLEKPKPGVLASVTEFLFVAASCILLLHKITNTLLICTIQFIVILVSYDKGRYTGFNENFEINK